MGACLLFAVVCLSVPLFLQAGVARVASSHLEEKYEVRTGRRGSIVSFRRWTEIENTLEISDLSGHHVASVPSSFPLRPEVEAIKYLPFFPRFWVPSSNYSYSLYLGVGLLSSTLGVVIFLHVRHQARKEHKPRHPLSFRGFVPSPQPEKPNTEVLVTRPPEPSSPLDRFARSLFPAPDEPSRTLLFVAPASRPGGPPAV